MQHLISCRHVNNYALNTLRNLCINDGMLVAHTLYRNFMKHITKCTSFVGCKTKFRGHVLLTGYP